MVYGLFARRLSETKTPLTKLYSNFSVINGDCGLALANDFTTRVSADSEVVFRAMAEPTTGS
jgi:hypothetical protein